MSYQPIEHHGVIGDLHTVALVGMDGAIDFMCVPEFDSPSVFAALLDERCGGRFELAPLLEGATRKQLYLPDTCVLLTRSLGDEGAPRYRTSCPSGTRRASTQWSAAPRRCAARCASACSALPASTTRGRRTPSSGRRTGCASSPRGAIAWRSASAPRCPCASRSGAAVAEFTLRADESAAFVLEQAVPGTESPAAAPDYVAEAFKRTVNFWRRWIGRSSYQGRWREMVNRSALTLKLLTSRPHGSIIASPTFGLPEQVGGERNWDYRYTWLRDAAFTLYALMRLGFTEEASAFMRWVEARCEELGPGGSLQIMYAIDGRHELPEETLPHLEGYMRSAPVRIGNAAHTHLQLDIYGELMDAIYLYDKYGEPISYDLWSNASRFIEWVCEHWREKDESIWEVRGGRQEFLYSRVQCWAAIDRAVRLTQKRSFPGPMLRWHDVRDEIHRDIFANFWDPGRKTFVQARGSTALDASALLMPLVRFISPTDPRWVSTLRAIERELVSDSLVSRYRLGDGFSDGLTGREGTFSMCSFWYVECLSRMGDLEQARFFFEKMLGYANHLGLYGEQLGQRGEHLGNFPQAFTHLALISAAYDLDRRLSAAGRTA